MTRERLDRSRTKIEDSLKECAEKVKEVQEFMEKPDLEPIVKMGYALDSLMLHSWVSSLNTLGVYSELQYQNDKMEGLS